MIEWGEHHDRWARGWQDVFNRFERYWFIGMGDICPSDDFFHTSPPSKVYEVFDSDDYS